MRSLITKLCALTALTFILFFNFAPAGYVFAGDTGYAPLEPLPGIYTDPYCNGDLPPSAECKTTLESYVPGMFKLLIGVAAALAVVMIVIGGIQYIGSESLWGKQDGKEKIQKAIWGLLLAIFAWLLLYSIDPRLTQFDLSINPTEYPQSVEPGDHPHTMRVFYRVANDPQQVGYVQCGASYESLQSCQANISQTESTFQNPPYSYAQANCVQNCTPITPSSDYYLRVRYRETTGGPFKIACYHHPGPAACQLALSNFDPDNYPNWTITNYSCEEHCSSYGQGTQPSGPGYWVRIRYRNNNDGTMYEAFTQGPYTGSSAQLTCNSVLNSSYPGPFPIVNPAGCNIDDPDANCTVIYNASCVLVE